MDGTLIQQKIYGGLQKAALRVGLPHQHYRPTSLLTPFTPEVRRPDILATFAPHASWYMFNTANIDKHITHALLDGLLVEEGDYLFGPMGPHFILKKPHIGPIAAISCNATIQLRRPALPAVTGLNGYGGDIEVSETVLATGWPASLSMAGGGASDSPLPASQGSPGFSIRLPKMPGLIILPADIAIDQNNVRYAVRAAVCDEGWSLSANLAVT